MEFESLCQMLRVSGLERVPVPLSAEIYNIFCMEDGDYVSTIQILEDENIGGRRITELAARLLKTTIVGHRLEHHIQVQLFYEDAAQTTVGSEQ
jgi:hypothetical protein